MKTARLPLLAALSWALSAHAAVPDRAGEVTFMIGEARITNGPDAGSVLKRGSPVLAGQQIETSDNGHLHIRFVDGAAVAVRPMTRLRIDDYSYTPNDPSQNRIRFFLQEGALRSITGKAGEANKERFRINTPVAAIGIRGTDFNVQTTGDLTRASLFQGAIVLSPLGGGCSAAALGPCVGATALELDERLRGAYALQAGLSDTMAQLVPKRLDAVAKPPLATAGLLPQPTRTDAVVAVVASAPETSKPQNEGFATEAVATSRVEQLAEIAPSILPPTVEPTPKPEVPVVRPEVPVVKPEIPVPRPTEVALAHEANPQVWWGRWAAYADPTNPGGTYEARRIPGRSENIGGNQAQGLLRTYMAGSQLPTGGGQASFALARYEAHTLINGTYTPAMITAASLSMNFDTRRFATQLSLAQANTALASMSAVGRIESDGRFYSDSGQDMTLSGGLANRGQQAGYAFERRLSLDTLLFGATAWTR